MPVVGPRIEFDPDHYPRLRVWDTDEKRDHYVYLHRLTAYAHGQIDHLFEAVDIHHENADGWDNRPENLEAIPREEHAARERHVENLKRSTRRT